MNETRETRESRESLDSIDQQLRRGDLNALELLDIVPIPMHGDRTARLRTLEEALEDFTADGEAASYLIQLKPKGKNAAAAPVAASLVPAAPQRQSVPATAPVSADNIYQGDGKLN